MSLLAAEATKTTEGQAGDKPVEQTDVETTKVETTEVSEQETAEGEKKTEDKKPDEKAKPEGAPEKYDFKAPKDFPEGLKVDDSVLEAFATVSRELDLPQDKAQKLLDGVMPAIHRRAAELDAKTVEDWTKQAKADKEYGGAKLEQSLGIAKKATEVYGSKAFRELMDGPFGNHPEVIRFAWKVGQTLSEDKFVGANKGERAPEMDDDAAIARKFYTSHSS